MIGGCGGVFEVGRFLSLPSAIGLAEDRGNPCRPQARPATPKSSRTFGLGVLAVSGVVLVLGGRFVQRVARRFEDGAEVAEGDRLEGMAEARPLDGDDPFLALGDEDRV